MLPINAGSLSLRDLQYAVAVGRERHFGRAAESCGVSQAALSEQLRKLEVLLGLALFERTKRKVEPTVRGAAILQQAEMLLADARYLLESARASAEPLTGELRLGVIPTLGPYYMPSVIALGRRRFPRMALRLQEATTERLLALLRHGDLDVALVALPVAMEGFVADPLFFEPFRLACPSDHVLAKRKTINLSDVARETLLLMDDGHCLRDQTLLLCDPLRLSQRSRHASSLEMLRHMIAAGEGVSLIPSLAASEHTTMHGMITYRDLAEPGVGRTIVLVRRATETRASDMLEVATFMRSELPDGVTKLSSTID